MDAGLTRRAFVGCLAAVATFSAQRAAHASEPRLREIVRRHVQARGGAEALDRVRSCLIELEISENSQTVQARYAAHEAGLVRIDIFAEGNLVYREGVDTVGVWMWPGGEPQPRPSAATGSSNALLHGAENHLFGLHRFPGRGHRLRLMPAETIDGTHYQVIEVVYSTGHRSYFYVDPVTWHFARRRDERAYHPDLDASPLRVETRYSEYVDVDGVFAAHRNVDVDLSTNAVLSTNQVTRRVLNPVLPDGLFDRAYAPG